MSLLTAMKNLNRLKLGGSCEITDKGLILICEKLKDLNHLIINGHTFITSEGFSQLPKLPNLKALNLENCKFQKDSLNNITKLTNLVSLNLNHSTNVPFEMLATYCKTNSNLRSVNFHWLKLTNQKEKIFTLKNMVITALGIIVISDVCLLLGIDPYTRFGLTLLPMFWVLKQPLHELYMLRASIPQNKRV